MKPLASMSLALLAAGCLGNTDSQITFTLDFDFTAPVGENWIPDGADFPLAQAAAVGLVGDRRPLPAPLNPARNALYLTGTSVGGDLFLFQKKFFTGLNPNQQYVISVAVEFASNYHAGCTSGPGLLTFFKGGVSAEEPLATPDAQGILRMNINKGAGAAPGDYVQFGDIRNSESGCPTPGTFASKGTVAKLQTARVTTDLLGGFWLWFGTQSSFAGSHEVYVLGMRMVVQ